MSKMIDLTGQRFNKLVAIKPLPKDPKDYGKSTCTKWLCKCDCGNETIVNSSNLRKNHTQSCGCLQRINNSKAHFKNITGQRFGKLVALRPDLERTKKEHHTYWICQCDCGGQTSVIISSLTKGLTKSCGCLKQSFGAYQIEKMLKENNILYQKEYYLTDGNNKFYFDFFVNQQYIIEFDGQQHFKSTAGWNSATNVELNHTKDLIKNKYCFTHNIPLIRIPYTAQDDLEIKDILPGSKFTLTTDNESIYYQKHYKG